MSRRGTTTGPSVIGSSALTVDALFEAAVERAGLVTRRYVVAGRPVEMRFAGPAMLSRLGGSFAHLETQEQTPDPFRIDIWDADSTGTEPPPALGTEITTDGTGEIASAVESFLLELEREQLIARANGAQPAAAAADPPEPAAAKAPFEAPRLERYTDMQDIILLDPVHQVDAAGWPHTAEAREAG